MKKNIVLTNMTKEQLEWLKKEADQRGITITGLIKYWCEKGIDRDKQGES